MIHLQVTFEKYLFTKESFIHIVSCCTYLFSAEKLTLLFLAPLAGSQTKKVGLIPSLEVSTFRVCHL